MTTLPPALALDAAAVAKVPVLGYELVDFPPSDVPDAAAMLALRRPWIAVEHDQITIDVGLFAVHAPFDAVLVEGSTTSKPVASLEVTISDFATRWELPARLPDRGHHRPMTDPLHVRGDIEALVWPAGMVIGVHEPFATAMKLLITAFSPEAFSILNRRAELQQTLALLPEDVTARHVSERSRRVPAEDEKNDAELLAVIARIKGRGPTNDPS
jgi:hypothetical protein